MLDEHLLQLHLFYHGEHRVTLVLCARYAVSSTSTLSWQSTVCWCANISSVSAHTLQRSKVWLTHSLTSRVYLTDSKCIVY